MYGRWLVLIIGNVQINFGVNLAEMLELNTKVNIDHYLQFILTINSVIVLRKSVNYSASRNTNSTNIIACLLPVMM